MTGVDLEKCKRIVQYFWDPEPKNDTTPESPIWCLGQRYTPTPPAEPHDTGMRPFLLENETLRQLHEKLLIRPSSAR
jgi:cysteine protease ATG4